MRAAVELGRADSTGYTFFMNETKDYGTCLEIISFQKNKNNLNTPLNINIIYLLSCEL